LCFITTSLLLTGKWKVTLLWNVLFEVVIHNIFLFELYFKGAPVDSTWISIECYTHIIVSYSFFWSFLLELCLFSHQLTNIHILTVLFHALYFQWMRKNFKRLTERNGITQPFFFPTHFFVLCSLHPRFQELLTCTTTTDADKNWPKPAYTYLQEIGLCLVQE